MSVADDLREREQQAGNAEDSYDPGQKHYDEQFNGIKKAEEDRDFDQIIADNYGDDTPDEKTDAHGDKVQRNYNADSADNRNTLEDKEKNPDSLYKSNSDASTAAGGFRGKLASGAKGFAPTGGIIGILLFGIIGLGGGSSFLAGSLLVNIKEVFHNDRADATGANQLFSRGFMANKFNNDGNKCDAKKPICRKMSYMQESELKLYQDEGFKVRGQILDANGKKTGFRTGAADKNGKLYPVSIPEGGGVLVEEVVYPDGTTTKNGKEFYAHADKDPSALRRTENAFNSRSAFYLNDFFRDLLSSKWKISKGAKAFPAPDSENNDPNNQRTNENNQDKAFNQEADTVHVDPNTTAADPNSPLRGQSEKIINEVNTKVNGTKGKLAAKGGALGSILQGSCTVYRLAYLVETSIKAYHAYQLIRFAYQFFKAADQIKYGDGDQNRVSYLSNNLVWYNNNSDGGKNLKYGLTATDSEGYKIAAHGDKSGLKAFSEKFLLGGSIGQKISDFTGMFENSIDATPFPGDNGHEKMRNLCRAAQSPLALIGTACAALVPALTASGTVVPGVGNIVGFALSSAACGCTVAGLVPYIDKLPDIIAYNIPLYGGCRQIEDGTRQAMDLLMKAVQSETVQKWVFEVLRDIHVDDNTKGVDAGNAIAAGAGLMLSTTATGYGLKPAANKQEVSQYIAANEDLDQTYARLDKDDARLNPFDIENKYSLVGSIARSLKTDDYAAAQKSLFGLFSTITGLYSSSLKIATGTPSASALYNMPSTLTEATARLDNCHSKALNNIGAIGDTYCSIVGVLSKAELDDARDQAYNPSSTTIANLITYMTTDQGEKSEADGGTYCDRNRIIEGLQLESDTTSSCGDPSEKRSIQDDGAPIEGSQYSMYLKYCTAKREAPWGDQYEDYTEGSERDQDWYSGKQCLGNSQMMRNFRMWTNYCLQYGTKVGKLNCYTNNQQANTPASGDACSLLNNPNIVYVYGGTGEGTKRGLREICEKGSSVNSCGNGGYVLDQELMNVLTTLSSKYKVQVNNFGFQYDRNSCDTGQHPRGKAVDLNSIEKLDGSGNAGGSGGGWFGINFSSTQIPTLNEYATDWLAAINPSHGGVGQKGCGTGFNPTFPANATNVNGAAFFSDSCDHLHIDVRDRGGPSAL